MENMTYLSDIISELPTNCLFNKGKVGCGGTTLAIEGNKPYVICVPFVSLIINKMTQYINNADMRARRSEPITAEYGGFRHSASFYASYLASTKVPVIMTTYDSLETLTKKLGDKVKDFNLLVDEYHILFNHYSFRSEAAQSVLTNYKKYKSFTFMTATPLEEDFLLEELKGIPVVTQNWDDAITVTMTTKPVTNVEKAVMKTALDFLSGKEKGNAYFFVNSIKMAGKMIEKLHLTTNDCRVIYSQNSKVELPIPNGSTMDEPKKINFLTSTVFEGSDIYDEEGRTFIISDGYKANTLVDISTSALQIIGRIRNSKYIGEATHIFSTTKYGVDMTYENYKADIEAAIPEAKEQIKLFNGENKLAIKMATGYNVERSNVRLLETAYVKYENGKYVFDENKMKIDLFNFKLLHGDYKAAINVNRNYQKAGVEVEAHKLERVQMQDIQIDNFLDRCKALEKAVNENGAKKITELSEYWSLIRIYPFMQEAIEILGLEEIRRLKYVQKKIKAAVLLAKNKDDIERGIKEALEAKIVDGKSYKKAKIKEILQGIYNDLKLDRKAKAKDIETWYIVKPVKLNTEVVLYKRPVIFINK
jgi:hypothetical protein